MKTTPAMELGSHPPLAADTMKLDLVRQAQAEWGKKPIRSRLQLLRAARHAIATDSARLSTLNSVGILGSTLRNSADTIVAEILPLLEAIRFLEKEAAWILRPNRTSSVSRPLWLRGVMTEVQRVPIGVVLILGPSNYPLFLPATQAFQALAAGNAVLWKPAPGGSPSANWIREILVSAGLDPLLLSVLDESREAAMNAVSARVDKVVLTGSAATGQAVMRSLAETLTPSVMELSGCDSAFVLNGADLDRVSDALCFSMRLNGSATCMAVRRLFVVGNPANDLAAKLRNSFSKIPPVTLPHLTSQRLDTMVKEAVIEGATILYDGRRENGSVGPVLISNATPEMRITQTDIFAPVLSIMRATTKDEALAAHSCCPYALTASVFGSSREAEAFGYQIKAGNILINDVIVATADPRAPFGGRGQSGFGVTRGREGLLEMTAVKTVQIQKSGSSRHYQPTTTDHEELFLGYIQAAHAKGWRRRWTGLLRLFAAARKVK